MPLNMIYTPFAMMVVDQEQKVQTRIVDYPETHGAGNWHLIYAYKSHNPDDHTKKAVKDYPQYQDDEDFLNKFIGMIKNILYNAVDDLICSGIAECWKVTKEEASKQDRKNVDRYFTGFSYYVYGRTLKFYNPFTLPQKQLDHPRRLFRGPSSSSSSNLVRDAIEETERFDIMKEIREQFGWEFES